MSLQQGQGLVLSVGLLGEKNRLLTVFAREQGKLKGMLRGLKTPPCQPLDGLDFQHFRRLDTQLGTYEAELTTSRAAWWLGEGGGVLVINWLIELLLLVLPDEHAYPQLYQQLEDFLAVLPDEGMLWQRVVALELMILQVVGYGVALGEDQVADDSGSAMMFVSPRTGRAVSAAMGQEYADKLLLLPAFLGGVARPTNEDCRAGLRLSGHFIRQALAEAGTKEKPLVARQRLVKWLTQASS